MLILSELFERRHCPHWLTLITSSTSAQHNGTAGAVVVIIIAAKLCGPSGGA